MSGMNKTVPDTIYIETPSEMFCLLSPGLDKHENIQRELWMCHAESMGSA